MKLESLLHSEHIIKIEKMSIGGDGVARMMFNERNVVIFIPHSAPQDQLKIKISRTEKTFLLGEIIEIIAPGPSRRQPPCPVAFECGGCSWQQFNEDEQIHQKEELLKELFKKFLPQIDYQLLPTIQTSQKFEYRNRIQLKHLGSKLGYFKSGSHEIVPISDCLIAQAPLRKKIAELNETLKPTAELKKYEVKINQEGQVEHYQIGESSEGLAFSQVNNSVNDLLIEAVLNSISKVMQLDSEKSITELYAGSGNFTFPLAKKFPKVKINAVELNPRLTAAAAENIKLQKRVKQINFFTAKCEIYALNYPLSRNLILLDPPRSGCHPDVIRKIADTIPENIVYISCHPTMLVRDLALLLKQRPEYRIQYLQIFDMFPQTDHFETLCVLTKVESH